LPIIRDGASRLRAQEAIARASEMRDPDVIVTVRGIAQ